MEQEIVNTIRQVASQLVKTLKTVYLNKRVLEKLPESSEFENLRLKLYDRSIQESEFTLLGDFADRTLEELGPAHEVRYRVFHHPSGAYLLQYIFEQQRIIELGSFYEQGGGMSTSNAWASRHLDNIPDWAVHHVTPDKSWNEIWDWHKQRMGAAALKNLSILRFKDLEEFLKLNLKRMELEQLYRQQIPGFVKEKELQAYLEQPQEIRETFYKELIKNSY